MSSENPDEVIITLRGKAVKRDVSLIPTGTPVTYLDDWERAHSKEHVPTVHVGICGDDWEAEAKAALAKGIISKPVFLAVLVHGLGKFKGDLSETIRILNKETIPAGTNITAGNLVNVVATSASFDKQTQETAVTLTVPQHARALLALMGACRIKRIGTGRATGEYINTLTERINEIANDPIFEGPSFQMDALVQAVSGWAEAPEVQALIAVYDLFFNLFPDHPYAKLKVSTLFTRFMDCAALTSLEYITKITNKTVPEFLTYLMTDQLAEEIIQLTKDQTSQKADNKYFPYISSMSFTKKCPYSTSCNPHLYTFIHAMGCAIGINRSKNARVLDDVPISQLVFIGIAVGYALQKSTKLRLAVFTSEKDRKNFEDDNGDEEEDEENYVPGSTFPSGDDPADILAYLQANGGAPTSHVIQSVKHQVADAGRENTIGLYIRGLQG